MRGVLIDLTSMVDGWEGLEVSLTYKSVAMLAIARPMPKCRVNFSLNHITDASAATNIAATTAKFFAICKTFREKIKTMALMGFGT